MGILGGDDGETTTRTDDDAGDGGESTTTTTAESGVPTLESYLVWLPAPEPFQGDEQYTVNYHDLAGFRDHRESMAKDPFNEAMQFIEDPESTLEVEPPAIEEVIQVGTRGTEVVLGEFDTGTITSGLSERRFENRDTYGGYDLYLRQGQDETAVAVGSEATLICRPSAGNDPLAVARMLVDTVAGDMERYVEVNDDFWLAMESLQDVTRAGGQVTDPPDDPDPATGNFAGNTAFAFGFTVGESTTSTRFNLVFENASQADVDDVRTWTEEGLPGLEQYEDYSVDRTGRLVSITGTIATGRFDFLDAGDPDE